MFTASLVGLGIMLIITAGAIPLERYVNQLTSRVLDRKKTAVPLAALNQERAAAGS
jgi:hypothetical protein